uniref:Uncharacterized protein n=1 Tax=Chrysotila carterae TaxID=13221 RepID=A0A7S4EV56_CHRCT
MAVELQAAQADGLDQLCAPVTDKHGSKPLTYSDDCLFARPAVRHPGFLLSLADAVASFGVAAQLLVRWETVLLLLTSAAIVLVFWGLSEAIDDFDESIEQVNLSFAWVAFVITFPLASAISASFDRRENALTLIGQLRAALISVSEGACSWKLPAHDGDGGPVSEVANGKVVAIHALAALKPMEAYLLSPTVSRARHFQFSCYTVDRTWVTAYQRTCQAEIDARLFETERAIDALSFAPRSLAVQEVSRLYQYLQAVRSSWHQLRCIKDYRQPLGLRTFSRLIIFGLPLFYGPQLFDSTSSNWMLGLPLCIGTQLLFAGLFAIQRVLEDPFISEEDDSPVETDGAKDGAACAGSISELAAEQAALLAEARPTGMRFDAIRVRAELANARHKIRDIIDGWPAEPSTY